MNRNTVLAVGLTAILVVVGCAAAYFITNDGDDDAEESAIAGHWYLAHYSVLAPDGSYEEKDVAGEAEMYDRGLDIIERSHSVFYGSYLGYSVTGSYEGNAITMCGATDRGEFYLSGALVDSNTLVVNDVMKEDGLSAWLLVFTKDGRSADPAPATADIAGDWQTVSAVSYSGGEPYAMVGEKLSLKQEGTVFGGTMEQSEGDTVVENKVCGYLLNVNGALIGRLVDQDGVLWNVFCTGGLLTCTTTARSETAGDAGTLVVVERTYSRDGTGTAAAAADLQGREWTSTDVYYASNEYNEITHYNKIFFLTVTSQEGSLIAGTCSFGSDEYPMTGYLRTAGGATTMYVGVLATDYGVKHVVTMEVQLKSNGDAVMYQYYNITKSATAPVYMYTYCLAMESTDAEPALAGHWYFTSSVTMDSSGWYTVEDSEDTVSHSDRDFFFIEVKDGLIYGRTEGEYFTATLLNGQFSVVSTVNGETTVMVGELINSNVLYVYQVHTDSDGEVESNYTLYTRDRTSTLLFYSAWGNFLKGNWICGAADTYDGESYDLLVGAQSLTVAKIKGTLFSGTMAQTVNGVTAEKAVTGVFVAATDQLVGIAVDASGVVWHIAVKEDGNGERYLVFSSVRVSETVAGEPLVAVERTYSRDGSVTEQAAPDRQGTVWNAVSREVMNSDGTVEKTDRGLSGSITFTAQDGCQAVGTRSGDYSGSFAAYDCGDQLWVLSDLTGHGLISGRCVFADGVLTLSETFADGDGTYTVVTTFVRSE